MTEPPSSVNGQDPNTPDRAELLGLYKTVIEEYRLVHLSGQKFSVGALATIRNFWMVHLMASVARGRALSCRPMSLSDTPPAIQERMDAAYRRMSPTEKIGRMAALTGTIRVLTLASIRAEYPGESNRQHSLRLAARFLTREQMIAAFGWDPEQQR